VVRNLAGERRDLDHTELRSLFPGDSDEELHVTALCR
jgi:hypothetical protein